MTRLKTLLVFVCLLGLTSPSASAREVNRAPGVVARWRAGLQNLAPRVGAKVESLRLTFKAKRGGFRDNQLVVSKARVFHTADGGTRRVTKLWSVSGGKLLPELKVVKSRGADGRSSGVSRTYSGNIRRLGSQLARSFEATLQDPVFKAAVAGDKRAASLWNARFEAAQQRSKEMDAKLGEPPLHPFANARGETIYVKGLADPRPFPVP